MGTAEEAEANRLKMNTQKPNTLMKSQLSKDEVRTRGGLDNENVGPTGSQRRRIDGDRPLQDRKWWSKTGMLEVKNVRAEHC